MKTHKVLFLALIVSAAFALSAQAGDRHRNNGNARTTASAPAHYSGGAIRSSSGFRYSGNRTFTPSSRMTMRSMPQFSQRRFVSGGNEAIVRRQFTPRTFTERSGNGVARFQNNRLTQSNRFARLQGQRGNRFAQLGNRGGNRTIGNISPGHNHVFAQRSASWNHNWDRRHDHFWNGHRCRFVNGSWFIFDIGFIPWFGWPYYDYYAYDYYPPVYPYGYGYGYDTGAYYGSNYYNQPAEYDQGGYNYNDQPNYNDQGENNDNGRSNYNDQSDSKSYNQGANALGSFEQSAATAADVQDQLKSAGYYHGKIDGVLGPETRHALVRYQSAKGLRVTGSLTPETQQSLGLAGQGGDQVTDQ